MRVLGLSGLFSIETEDYPPDVHPAFFHDSAACIVQDGLVVAAVEEERLSRDKHTNRFPGGAVRECLELAACQMDDIDVAAYFFDGNFTNRELQTEALHNPGLEIRSFDRLIADRLSLATGDSYPAARVTSVRHHDAHAASTLLHSGFESTLVAVLDGNGEKEGATVYNGIGKILNQVCTYPRSTSLGHFYTLLTRFIGYENFDEYKVMGLASFGDAARYSTLLEGCYTLLPKGQYDLSLSAIVSAMLDKGLFPRRADEPVTDQHRDLAAAAQRALERIALHIITYWAMQTKLSRLCLAGGVAQNTSLNGKLLQSGIFEAVYVHPASHDAGAAMGAAMLVDARSRPSTAGVRSSPTLTNVYLGRDIGHREALLRDLTRWRDFVSWEEPIDLPALAGQLLADGDVLGWARGRAEFGPRALGNRSILADPRPAANRDRVNRLIKNRESYRPFAPVVCEVDALRYFDLPAVSADYGYMGFVVPVRAEHRGVLGAITHVDGSARIQILRPGQNPELERTVAVFAQHTGIAVLLNTSFNNDAEPIVHSAEDAIVCFITTGLSALVLGPYLVRHRLGELHNRLRSVRVQLSPWCELVTIWRSHGISTTVVRRRTNQRKQLPVSEDLAYLISSGNVADSLRLGEGALQALTQEILSVWEKRLVRVQP